MEQERERELLGTALIKTGIIKHRTLLSHVSFSSEINATNKRRERTGRMKRHPGTESG